jgi:predicted dehydrogenase
MAPIRTALVGFSSKASASWGRGVHLPYLLSPAGKEKFVIVAMLNSSVDAAKLAITTLGLPPHTRAYGDPEALAADKEVDFVVCTTRVDSHYPTVLPSVRAGKDVFVEWPLAHNAARANELASLAKESGSRTVVGFQGWFAPAVLKMQEVLASGRIGKVLSSDVRGSGTLKSRDSLPVTLKYFTDSNIGGNPYTIGFGHMFDYVQLVLGDIRNPKSHLQIQRPELKVRDPKTGDVLEKVSTDVPDLIHVTGSLVESDQVVQGATLHVTYTKGPVFKGEPGMAWNISGEKGNLRLLALGGSGINASAHMDPLTITLHDFETDELEEIEWSWPEGLEIPPMSSIVGSLYEAYAAGDKSKYPDFAHAAKRHDQLDQMLKEFQGLT